MNTTSQLFTHKPLIAFVALTVAAPGSFLVFGATFFWNRGFAKVAATFGVLLSIALFVLSLRAFAAGQRRAFYGFLGCAVAFGIIILLPGYLKVEEMRLNKVPNKPAAGDAGIASQSATMHHRPGVPEQGR